MSYARERDVGEAFAKSLSKDNVIRFDALECRLHGKFKAVNFGPWAAVSGAGLNSYKKLQGTKLSDWLSSKKTTGKLKGQRGGVLPPGWWVALPEILSAGQTSSYVGKGKAPTDFSIKLVPFRLETPDPSLFGECNRGGFYIHGASKNDSKIGAGSDGCILLAPDERKWLASKVMQSNGSWLYVYINGQKINDMIDLQLSGASLA